MSRLASFFITYVIIEFLSLLIRLPPFEVEHERLGSDSPRY